MHVALLALFWVLTTLQVFWSSARQTPANGFICNFAASSSKPKTGSTEPIESELNGGEVERVCDESEEWSESEQLSLKLDEEPLFSEGTSLSFKAMDDGRLKN